eukprot:12942714-Alexandrium_andersonii.AAC.1
MQRALIRKRVGCMIAVALGRRQPPLIDILCGGVARHPLGQDSVESARLHGVMEKRPQVSVPRESPSAK